MSEPSEHREIESAFDAALPNVVGPYATRVAFALDRLQATQGRADMIPIADLAEQLSLILGRNVTREQFLENAQDRPENDDVLEGMARLLEVDHGWLLGDE